ncbi:diacylglycerol kinase family protein [Candidatus Peregrinibacteria bacterium]|nr:diacylglycerol kinase family protein [Candidatus Peregrinibacteria bacterium]MBI3816296.1 diacylglycerol kinase family protein [Candidatus Peregrinibacteria bacterium]
MIKTTVRSFGHAKRGFQKALKEERNFRLFLSGFIALLVVSSLFNVERWQTVALALAGGFFLSIELLNTALEHLTDCVDELRVAGSVSEEYHAGLRATKDVAAAASLVSFIVILIVIVLILFPAVMGQ